MDWQIRSNFPPHIHRVGLISLLMGSSPKVSYGIAMGEQPNQSISNSILQKTKQASQHIFKTPYDKFGIDKVYPTKPGGQE